MSPLGVMVFRLYRPTGFTLLMTTIAWGYTATLPTVGTFAPIYSWFQWLPPILLLVATSQWLHATYRLWRWDSRGVDTCECGGLLGRERIGQWGAVSTVPHVFAKYFLLANQFAPLTPVAGGIADLRLLACPPQATSQQLAVYGTMRSGVVALLA